MLSVLSKHFSFFSWYSFVQFEAAGYNVYLLHTLVIAININFFLLLYVT